MTKPATAKTTRPTAPRPKPSTSFFEAAPSFFSRSFSSPPASSTARGFLAVAGWPLALTFPLFGFLVSACNSASFIAGASSAAASGDPGSSITKRYLHFGQSIFLPMRLALLIGTSISQLGQGCLKAAWTAMNQLHQGWDSPKNRNPPLRDGISSILVGCCGGMQREFYRQGGNRAPTT